MNRFAVIDVGSNSVRLMFVADGKVLYKSLNTTRLGEGIVQTGCLTCAAVERSALAVAEFYERALQEGAERVFAFATAAVRSAKNRELFLERVKTLCGLNVEVISGEEEAEIGILGALGNSDGGVVDVGGASTEIVVKKQGSLIYKKSLDIGVVRLRDKCGRDKNALKTMALSYAKEYEKLPVDTLYAIGGTATTLAALKLGLQEYNSELVTGAVITMSEMELLAEKLSALSVEEIAALPCMPKGRADVLSGGAVLLSALMNELNVKKLIVSDRDNLEGYAIKHGYMV